MKTAKYFIVAFAVLMMMSGFNAPTGMAIEPLCPI
jgi:hypothetical protein